MRHLLLPALLGMSATAAFAAAPPRGIVAPEIRRTLDAMGEALAGAPRLRATVRATRRLEAEGFLQQVSNDYRLSLERPNRLSLRCVRGVYGDTTVSDGARLYVYEPSHGHYFTRPAPPDLETVMEESQAEQAPGLAMLAGLLSDRPIEWLLEGVTRAARGPAERGADLLRFDFAQEGLDWSLWLEARPPHWPRRVEERNGAGESYPAGTTMRTVLELGPWETGAVAAEEFRFVPPAGVTEASHGGGAENGEGETALEKPAPDLRFGSLAAGAGEISLAALRGQVVVLELWASWCEPCVRALPDLQATAQDLAGRDVVFLAVNQGEDAATARAFLEGRRLDPLRFVLDEASQAGDAFGAEGIPFTAVIGRDGVVRAVHGGYSASLSRRVRADIDKALAAR